MYRNSKHYPDPTAGTALAHISHEKRLQQKHNDCNRQSTDDVEPSQLTMPASQSRSRLHLKTKWKNMETDAPFASKCICAGNRPFQDLAIAVIRQAVYDYLALGRRLQKCKYCDDMREIEDKMKAISRFFLGHWYSILSDNIDGGMILEVLDREVFGDD